MSDETTFKYTAPVTGNFEVNFPGGECLKVHLEHGRVYTLEEIRKLAEESAK